MIDTVFAGDPIKADTFNSIINICNNANPYGGAFFTTPTGQNMYNVTNMDASKFQNNTFLDVSINESAELDINLGPNIDYAKEVLRPFNILSSNNFQIGFLSAEQIRWLTSSDWQGNDETGRTCIVHLSGYSWYTDQTSADTYRGLYGVCLEASPAEAESIADVSAFYILADNTITQQSLISSLNLPSDATLSGCYNQYIALYTPILNTITQIKQTKPGGDLNTFDGFNCVSGDADIIESQQSTERKEDTDKKAYIQLYNFDNLSAIKENIQLGDGDLLSGQVLFRNLTTLSGDDYKTLTYLELSTLATIGDANISNNNIISTNSIILKKGQNNNSFQYYSLYDFDKNDTENPIDIVDGKEYYLKDFHVLVKNALSADQKLLEYVHLSDLTFYPDAYIYREGSHYGRQQSIGFVDKGDGFKVLQINDFESPEVYPKADYKASDLILARTMRDDGPELVYMELSSLSGSSASCDLVGDADLTSRNNNGSIKTYHSTTEDKDYLQLKNFDSVGDSKLLSTHIRDEETYFVTNDLRQSPCDLKYTSYGDLKSKLSVDLAGTNALPGDAEAPWTNHSNSISYNNKSAYGLYNFDSAPSYSNLNSSDKILVRTNNDVGRGNLVYATQDALANALSGKIKGMANFKVTGTDGTNAMLSSELIFESAPDSNISVSVTDQGNGKVKVTLGCYYK